MNNLRLFAFSMILIFAFNACGETQSTRPKEPDNFPYIKKKKSINIYKPFGRGLSHKIVTFQQYHETGGEKGEKHLITIAKPKDGRELKLDLPLDMETVRKFRRIKAENFEGGGPIVIGKEHQFKDRNQINYWQYQKDSTSTKVYFQEGTYSFIRQNDFEMLQIYDSANDIEYLEMKLANPTKK